MRRMTGQLLLILYSFLFLLLSPADLNFVVGFLVSLICIGMQMFLKDDWERYVLLICILAGSWYCVGICEFLPVIFLWILDEREPGYHDTRCGRRDIYRCVGEYESKSWANVSFDSWNFTVACVEVKRRGL